MKKIGIDAGHGLKTPGKQTPDGIKENEINDKVADKTEKHLKDYYVEIIRTDNDEGNVDESLSARVKKYIDAGVDIFVSIHHNALDGKWGKHKGIEVYVDRNATKEDLELANLIYKKLVKYTGLEGRGIKRANFTVINQNKITAVLVEGGFMDSEIDYPVITSDKGQEAYARAVSESCIEFLELKKRENISEKTNNINTNISKAYTVKITTEVLNVREKPNASKGTKINTTVKKGEVYTIVEESNGFGKLKSGKGWICLAYTSRNTSKTTTSEECYLVKIDTAVLNVREEPNANKNTKINTTVKRNEVYTIIKEKNGWGKLKSGEGWIKLSYTKKVK